MVDDRPSARTVACWCIEIDWGGFAGLASAHGRSAMRSRQQFRPATTSGYTIR